MSADLAAVSDREIVADVENERVIIGAMAANPEQLKYWVVRIPPDAFEDEWHKAILAAMRQVVEAGAECHPDTIAELSGLGIDTIDRFFKGYGGLANENLEIHVNRQLDQAAKVSALKSIDAYIQVVTDPSVKPVDAAEILSQAVREVSSRVTVDYSDTGQELSQWYVGELQAQAQGKATGCVPFGFSGLDDVMYQGAFPGGLTVVAARPAVGKTVWSANFALRQAQAGRKVLALPVEPGRRSFMDIFICAATGIPGRSIVRNPAELIPEQKKLIVEATRTYVDSEMVIVNDSPRSIAAVEALVIKHEPDVVVIDMLTYILPPDWTASTVGELLFRIRDLGKPRKNRNGHHSVALHHLRRKDGSKKLKAAQPPTLDELKNSGGWEEAADQVLLLHRRNYHNPGSEPDDIMEVEIAKQRRGPMHVRVGYEFDASHNRIGQRRNNFNGATDIESLIDPEAAKKRTEDEDDE